MEPPIITVYGPSGRGKSVDCLYSFPTGLFLTPAPGGLIAASVLIGSRVREERITTIDAAARLLQTTTPVPTAVVLDDFTILSERTAVALGAHTGGGGYKAWGALNLSVQKLRNVAVEKGITLVLNTHEAPPDSTDAATFLPGGPKMPSKKLTTTLPHVANLVLRAEHDSFRRAPLWHGVYGCNTSDSRWTVKDRYCVLAAKNPMNLREILVRACEIGHDVPIPPRLPDLGWLDEAAEGVARGLSSGTFGNPSEAAKALTQVYGQGRDPKHLRWAHRDGCARAELRKNSGVFDLFTTQDGAGTGLTLAAV